MYRSQAFVPGAPLPSHRRALPRSHICMTETPPPESSQPDKTPKKKPIKTVRSNATWANTFLSEFGSKGPGSRPDSDLRPMSLRTEAEGKGTCDGCKGTGTATCSFCMGLDHMADGAITPCPACQGKKIVRCSVCYGTAKEIELVENWWVRGLAAMFKE